MASYVVVCGGVFSSSGKGVSAAALALLMKMRGLKISYIKLDPYLNLNADTLAPAQHGEAFVCADGTVTDMDLGTIFRITGIEMSGDNILTGGSLYKELLEDEENGKYLGMTVQTSHITEKIIEKLEDIGKDQDIVFVEIGGTVGDAEIYPFLEATRQFKQRYSNNVLVAMVAPILWVPSVQEFKTKPLQNSLRTLQSFGLQADMLLCRIPADPKLPPAILDKISHLTGIPRIAIFPAVDVKYVGQVPIEFYEQGVDSLICDRFHTTRNGVKINRYRDLVEKYVHADELPTVNIGIVGKYLNADESYISIKESLYHAGLSNNVRVNRHWIFAEDVENCKDIRCLRKLLADMDAIIIPGGFDSRGVEGKIRTVKYCRENKVPLLGICLGLQCMVIEFARNVCDLDKANSVEFDKDTLNPVIHFVEGQDGLRKKSGTMRLGDFSCEIVKETLAHAVYKKKAVSERHRHRYEVNSDYVGQMADKGLIVSGKNPESGLVEIMELTGHPYFIGSQYHGEYRSRLGTPAPLFDGLVAAAILRSTDEAKFAYKKEKPAS